MQVQGLYQSTESKLNIYHFFDKVSHDVYGHGEHDRAVVLRGDVTQSLEIPQLRHEMVFY